MKITSTTLTLPIACLAAIASANTWIPTAAGTYDFNDPDNWIENTVPDGIDAVAGCAVDLTGSQTINIAGTNTFGTLLYGDIARQPTTGGQTFPTAPGALIIMSASSGHALIKRNGDGNTVNINPNIRLDTTTIIDNSNVSGAYEMYLGGAISGDGGLIKTNAAKIFLGLYDTNHNTYDGLTTVAGGTLFLNKNNRIAIPGDILITSGMLQLNRANNIADTSLITMRGSGRLRLSATTGSAYSDTIGGLESDSADVVLDSYATGGTSVLTLLDDSDRTYAGMLQDGGRGGILSIVKQGAGHWTLTGTNTHTGATTISGAGSIVVNAPSIMTGSPVQLTLGGTLGGDGIVSQLVTCADGRLAPGTRGAVGTLTLAGGIDVAEALAYDWQLTELSETVGFDTLVASAGAIAPNASCTVRLDFSLLPAEDRPDTPELAAFWLLDRRWTIALPADETTAVPFSEVDNGTGWAGGHGSFSVSDGGDGTVVLRWTAPPSKNSLIIIK